MTTKWTDRTDLGCRQGTEPRTESLQPDLRRISKRFIAGDLSAEAAIEMANDYHKFQAEEAGPPF